MVEERDWVGTGEQIELTGSRQEAAEKEFEKRYTYAVKSQTHLWIITLCHYAADATLDALFGESDQIPMLDTETIAVTPAVGCYVCESAYNPRIRLNKCTGDPLLRKTRGVRG